MATGMTWITRETPNGIATVNFNSVFTSTYDFYCIVATGNTSAGAGVQGVNMRLRLSGTDDTGSNYARQRTDAAATSLTSIRAISTSMQIGTFSEDERGGFVCEIGYPAIANETSFESHIAFDNGSGATLSLSAGVHYLTTAYDGMTLFLGTGNFTDATFDVYGYSTT